MMLYIVGALFPLLVTWCVYTANPMFPRFNRPEVFRGSWGNPFFGTLIASVILLSISGVIWIFATFSWWLAVLLIAGSVVLGDQSHIRLPPFLTDSALVLIGGTVGLIALHWIAWSVFPP